MSLNHISKRRDLLHHLITRFYTPPHARARTPRTCLLSAAGRWPRSRLPLKSRLATQASITRCVSTDKAGGRALPDGDGDKAALTARDWWESEETTSPRFTLLISRCELLLRAGAPRAYLRQHGAMGACVRGYSSGFCCRHAQTRRNSRMAYLLPCVHASSAASTARAKTLTYTERRRRRAVTGTRETLMAHTFLRALVCAQRLLPRSPRGAQKLWRIPCSDDGDSAKNSWYSRRTAWLPEHLARRSPYGLRTPTRHAC